MYNPLVQPGPLASQYGGIGRGIVTAKPRYRGAAAEPETPGLTTIGTASRDYSTITLWEADLDDAGVYSANDDAVGEMYNDSVFDESVTIDGGGTIGLNSITLTVAEGERHDGTAGTGARMVAGGFNSSRLIVSSSVFDLFWLEIDANANRIDSGLIDLFSAGVVTTRKTGRTILHGLSTGFPGLAILVRSFNGSSAGEYDIVFNNIVYSINGGQDGNAGVEAFEVDLYNNTFHNITATDANSSSGFFVKQSTASQNIKNNIVTDADGDAFNISGGVESHNASSDATASGTGSLTNIVTADQYVSTVAGSEDLHLKPGSDCIDAGTDLGTTPEGVNIDIDGYDRDAGGVTWDIGADQEGLPA